MFVFVDYILFVLFGMYTYIGVCARARVCMFVRVRACVHSY